VYIHIYIYNYIVNNKLITIGGGLYITTRSGG